ncbi:hypothetical protein B0J13DRAFT_329744 [Dactylonectria estremocensis]|uniref:Uncharacterized protein n=1 Tax=Dactylonectria estremocensis TaxID=1079267 RepID=A0A9P9J5Z6_9HYPO|nr:hypothetical protein B0J13DRAFT_329744 [Dactylonectria estremocensis]
MSRFLRFSFLFPSEALGGYGLGQELVQPAVVFHCRSLWCWDQEATGRTRRKDGEVWDRQAQVDWPRFVCENAAAAVNGGTNKGR